MADEALQKAVKKVEQEEQSEEGLWLFGYGYRRHVFKSCLQDLFCDEHLSILLNFELTYEVAYDVGV